MSYLINDPAHPGFTRLRPVDRAGFTAWEKQASAVQRQWADSSGFEARPGQLLPLQDADGCIESVLFGMQDDSWLYQLAGIYRSLPPGRYSLDCNWSEAQLAQACLGWGLAAYSFDRYRKNRDKPRELQDR